jgi:hypothetical protein
MSIGVGRREPHSPHLPQESDELAPGVPAKATHRYNGSLGSAQPEVRGSSDVAVRDSTIRSEFNQLVAAFSLHLSARMAH